MSEENQNTGDGGNNNSQSGGEGNNNNQNQQNDKLNFNEVQRQWIENHGNEMFAKGAKKVEDSLNPKLTEATSKIADLQKEIDALKNAAKESGKKKEQQNAEAEQVQQLQARIEEMQGIVARITGEKNDAVTKLTSYETERAKNRKSQEFLKAIPDNIKFFSNDEVYTLLEPVIKEENGQFVVINPKTGMPRLGNDLSSPMTLSEYISQFAAEKPHLVKAPDADGGTGQGETRRTQTKNGAVDIDDLPNADFEALLQKVKAGQA